MGCCSGYNFAPTPDAALDPNQRVNFTFGMVLGVDDFRQEHAYLAARDQRALRELIGYGALGGLDVSTHVSVGAEVEVRVAPGLALLPDGRLVGVAAAQCARLDQWLAGGPGEAGATGRNGPASVYVVLRHQEVSGTPVPIPGEPCRDESALLADARIADSFALDFSWTPPAHTEEVALRAFAAWLRRVEVRDAPEDPPDLATFQQQVEVLAAAAIAAAAEAFVDPPRSASPPVDAPPAALVIPRERYAEYIHAAFDVWVRRLRTTAMAHFGPVPAADAAAEGGLLLAAIDITLVQGLLADQGEASARARWLGRAQLLHLRLLQEWLVSDAENDAPREADYLLGRFDARLPHAQFLDQDFAAHDHAIARVDLVASPRPDDPGATKAQLVAAQKWPAGGTGPGESDYYGPHMAAPVRVEDGGSGQQDKPARGELLIGIDDGEGAPGRFILGRIYAKPHALGEGEDSPSATDLVVEVDEAPGVPHIGLRTAQGITPLDSPVFAGLSVEGAVAADSLSLAEALPVASGGTGQSQPPQQGQLLVGLPAQGEDPARFALGGLYAAVHEAGGQVEIPNLRVDAASAAPDILIDTVQGISEFDSPSFAGLSLASPLAVASGGTGLAAAPRKLQLPVGLQDGGDGGYVLARLVDSATVSVNLEPAPANPGEWQIRLEAQGGGGGGIPLPLPPDQGGSGQTGVPVEGQLLLGDGAGRFRLGELHPATPGRHLALAVDGAGLAIDTTPQAHWATRIVEQHGDRLQDSDHVLLLAFDDNMAFELGKPQDERVVVLKSVGKGPATIVPSLERNEDLPFIDAEPAVTLEFLQSITLIGSEKFERWFIIGRS